MLAASHIGAELSALQAPAVPFLYEGF